jgi:hypothetical protein
MRDADGEGPSAAAKVAPPFGREVEFVSQLTPMHVTEVLTVATLTNTGVSTILFAGPVLALVGALTNSPVVLSFGQVFLVALPVVPLLSFAVAYLGARRKAAKALYEPLGVTADEAGLTLTVGDETRRAEWTDFSRWRRVRGSRLLYNTTRSFVILRVEGLDPSAVADFEDLLRRHIAQGPRR